MIIQNIIPRMPKNAAIVSYFVLFLSIGIKADIITKEIIYTQDSMSFKGCLAYDDKINKKRPAILVIHEWWGLNDFTKMKVKDLAGLGYVAFAPDMYGNGRTATEPAMAAKMAGGVRGTALMRKRVMEGLQVLMKQEQVDTARVAAIGFCFGGTAALELAYAGAPVKGIVTFHGGIISPSKEDMPKIRTKFLILHGADDPNVPAEAISGFEDAMRKAGADWQIVYYGNAVHGFTNPGAGNDNAKGAAYNPLAAERSWKQMQMFLREIFSEKAQGIRF